MPTNDPLGNVLPGDQTPNTARMWNALTGEARRARQTTMGEAAAGDSPDVFAEPAAVVGIRAGAAGINPFTVSAFGPAVTQVRQGGTEARRRPVFEFATPSDEADPVAITVEAAGPRANARAAVAGVALCRLLVRDTAHRYAAPVPGESAYLGSAAAGYPILHRYSTAGVVWAFVLLDRRATAGPAVESGSGGGSGDGTLGYFCLGPFQTVVECGYMDDGVTPRLEVTTKYVMVTATVENGRVRFTTTESDEPCGTSPPSPPSPPPPPPPPPPPGGCYDGPGEILAGHPDQPVDVPGVGSGVALWNAGAARYEVTIEGSPWYFACDAETGIWTVNHSAITETGTATDTPVFRATFNPDPFVGVTGPIVLGS